MTGEEMYAAACAARVAEAEANPVMLRQRDGRLEPRPVPKFTPWARLSSTLQAQWDAKASRESPISETGADRG